MIYNLLDETYINNLKKKITAYLTAMIFLIIVSILDIVFVFIFQTRETMLFFTWLGTIILSCVLIAISVIFFTLYGPNRKLYKVIDVAFKVSPSKKIYTLTNYYDGYETYEGYDVKKVTLKEVDGTIDLINYLKAENAIELEVGKDYIIQTYNRLILSIEEKTDEGSN